MNPYIIPGIIYADARILSTQQRQTLFSNILATVCEVYAESPIQVKRNYGTRKREQVEIRQVCITIFCKRHNATQKIAGAFFDKDHATALHSIETVKNLRNTNRAFREKTAEVMRGVNFDDE